MTSDLQAEFERTAGRSLEWFFDQWMRRPGVAELRPSWKWDATAQRLMVTVTQATRFPPYRLALTVDVTDASGRTTRVPLVIPAQATVTLPVPVALSGAPVRVVFDADAGVLGTLTVP
jgi:aminopeptidase N